MHSVLSAPLNTNPNSSITTNNQRVEGTGSILRIVTLKRQKLKMSMSGGRMIRNVNVF